MGNGCVDFFFRKKLSSTGQFHISQILLGCEKKIFFHLEAIDKNLIWVIVRKFNCGFPISEIYTLNTEY